MFQTNAPFADLTNLLVIGGKDMNGVRSYDIEIFSFVNPQVAFEYLAWLPMGLAYASGIYIFLIIQIKIRDF